MRKWGSLIGLMAMLSLFSGSVLAEKYDQCDVLKSGGYTRGLFGLCIAYWTAVDKGKGEEAALGRYVAMRGDGDPYMPGLGDPDAGPGPDPAPEPETTCPCLDASINPDWGMGVSCVYDGNYADGFFVNLVTNGATIFATENDGVTGICSIEQTDSTGSKVEHLYEGFTLEEYDVCVTELLDRCAEWGLP
jgi:hypothetical protein